MAKRGASPGLERIVHHVYGLKVAITFDKRKNSHCEGS